LVCRFGHKEIELDIELLVDEVEKAKLIFGKSIDLGLNEGGVIFTFHNINPFFFKKFLYYKIQYHFVEFNHFLQNKSSR